MFQPVFLFHFLASYKPRPSSSPRGSFLSRTHTHTAKTFIYPQSHSILHSCVPKPPLAPLLHISKPIHEALLLTGICVPLHCARHCTIKISFPASSRFVKGGGDTKTPAAVTASLKSQRTGHKVGKSTLSVSPDHTFVCVSVSQSCEG